MTNLSKENRSLLEGTYSILSGAVKVLRTYDSADRLTHKVLLGLSDGASVETVLMHHDYGYSACLSSQVLRHELYLLRQRSSWFMRNLTAGEILAQLYYFDHVLLPRENVSAVSSSWGAESHAEP